MADGAIGYDNIGPIQKRGWIRFLTIPSAFKTDSNHEAYQRASLSVYCIINRNWNYRKSETHSFIISFNSDGMKILPILSFSSAHLIKKLRFVSQVGPNSQKFLNGYLLYTTDESDTERVDTNISVTALPINDYISGNVLLNLEETDSLNDPQPYGSSKVYELTLKANSWLGSEDSWPLT